MEQNLSFNWTALVEEARQRRKKINLTQAKLSMLAGVSTPTISNFENGNENVQVSSILKIFSVLGMINNRNLIFIDKKGALDFSKDTVVFFGIDGSKNIKCQISREGLEDYFDDSNNPVETFRKNRKRIEYEAKKKYLANKLEADGSILVKTEDLL
jgi:transcriptional regulator with XRE-family HTH domain